jgi:hypothetical protein
MLVMCISHIVQVPVTDVISFLINFQGFSIRDIWRKLICFARTKCLFLHDKNITVEALDLN